MQTLIEYSNSTGQIVQTTTPVGEFTEEMLAGLAPAEGNATLLVEQAPTELFTQGAFENYRVQDGVVVYAGPSLEEVKARAFERIDAKTDEIISRGFTFMGKRFSISIEAQSRALGMDTLRYDPAMSYPISWNTIDDNDAVSLASPEMVHGFVLTGIGTYRAVIDTGTDLKSLVRSATDVAAVEAIVDPRT